MMTLKNRIRWSRLVSIAVLFGILTTCVTPSKHHVISEGLHPLGRKPGRVRITDETWDLLGEFMIQTEKRLKTLERNQ